MNENKELLTYLYHDISMALDNLTLLIKKINKKDNKIKKVIEEVIKGYEENLKETKKLLKQFNFKEEKLPLINKMGAYMGINMEIMKDNSDARIADMLIQGMTMGILSAEKNIHKYENYAEKEILNLTNNFKKFQQDSIEKLKKYL